MAAPGEEEQAMAETEAVPPQKARVRPPAARPVSGRTWKTPETQRSSAVKAKPKKADWATRVAEREARKVLKEREAELLEERKDRKLRAKKKREENKARRQANEFKSSTYQVINNEKTIKSQSKKQLRMIKRTRMSKEGQIELVDAYAPTLGDASSASRPAKKRRR